MPRDMGYPSWRRSNNEASGACEATGGGHLWSGEDSKGGEKYCTECGRTDDASAFDMEFESSRRATEESEMKSVQPGKDWQGKRIESKKQRRLERLDAKVRIWVDPKKKKSVMQREAEAILRLMCQDNEHGLKGRMDVLSRLLKEKKKWEKRRGDWERKTNTKSKQKPPFLPRGRERPANFYIAACLADMQFQEGPEMNKIGVDATLDLVSGVARRRGEQELFEGDSRRRMKKYLSGDYKKMKTVFRRKRPESDKTWANFIDATCKLMVDWGGEIPSGWLEMTAWLTSQDPEEMTAKLPTANSARDSVSFELVWLSLREERVTRKGLAESLGWRKRVGETARKEEAERLIEIWRQRK